MIEKSFIHLTFSGLRRAVGLASELKLIKSTNEQPAGYLVVTSDGKDEIHFVSSDVLMFLLRKSIGYVTEGLYPSMDTIDDIFD